MVVNKLLLLIAIGGLLCTPCFAENDIKPFSPEWIDLYQSKEAFPYASNGEYYVQEGVLFLGNTLISYPREKMNKEYRVPEGVEIIASCAFEGNQYLEKVVLPSSITCIGDSAFEGCTELQAINLPDRLLVIGSAAFANCSSIECIVLPSQLYVIGDQAFCDASALTGTLTIPASVKYIGAELLCNTNISTIIFEGCVYHVGPSLIGKPNPLIHYVIQVPDLYYSFAEALQEEYTGFDNIVLTEMVSVCAPKQ